MPADDSVIDALSGQHGLAITPLFRPGEVLHEGEHAILLDGAHGSFALSTSDEVDPLEASSWAWSSNVPHHVSIKGDDVHVIRWDCPNRIDHYERSRVFSEPTSFYHYLRDDRVEDTRTIVEHSIRMFRKVRSIVDFAKLEDSFSISAYLLLLGALVGGDEPNSSNLVQIERKFDLPIEAKDVVAQLPNGAIDQLFNEFQALGLRDKQLAAFPSLAVRHASGPIFQEAHFQLLQGSIPDFFHYVAPARVASNGRGTVHFTPPLLARSLCEQVLAARQDLKKRKEIVIADIACGSGAFLIEALRALERVLFEGSLVIFGRDTSKIAVDMARFVVGIAAREWPGEGRFKIDLAVSDSLRNSMYPAADIIVMNPPFAQWQDLEIADRELLKSMLFEDAGSRPDLSMAFLGRAIDSLNERGALATLLPASVLEAKSAAKWRRKIMERKSTFLTAIFDNQNLFSHATVRVGALVLSADEVEERIELRVGNGSEDTGDALRALRKGCLGYQDGLQGSFSLNKVREHNSSGSWATGSTATKPLTRQAAQLHLTTVGSLFEVQQGIRTGENPAFVLSLHQLLQLPKNEQVFFRPAITSKGMISGQIIDYSYLFYPYFDESLFIEDEASLIKRLPAYFEQYLRGYKGRLAGRRGRARRWWDLSERRPGLEVGQPTFVSKYWAKPGGFVLRQDSRSVVIQGFGWIPTDRLRPILATSAGISEVAAAYLAILNSQTFFSLVAEHAPPTGGGQLDMSLRYLRNVPLIDFGSQRNDLSLEINLLANFSYERYLTVSPSFNVSDMSMEECVESLLGTGRTSEESFQRQRSAYPEWLAAFIRAGLNDSSREDRVQLLTTLQELAKGGAYHEIDASLSQDVVSQLAETSLITLLRGTFRFRSKLMQWTNFRDRVAFELENRGAATDKLLIGLYS